VTLRTTTALLALRTLLTELAEERLQGIRKIVETTAIKVEGEAVALVIGDGVDTVFDTHGNNCRRNRIDDVREARNRRGLNLYGFGIRTGDFEGNTGRKHRSGKAGDGRSLQRGIERRSFDILKHECTFFDFNIYRIGMTRSGDEARYRTAHLTANCPTDEKFVMCNTTRCDPCSNLALD
jgi:hypothetical protein